MATQARDRRILGPGLSTDRLPVLRGIVFGPLLGWICLIAPLLVMSGYGLVTDQLLVGPLLGVGISAIVLNLCTWLTAIIFGRTRQLRSSWLCLAAVLVALAAAASAWPDWGHELEVIIWMGLLGLGVPTSLIMFIIDVPRMPRGLEVLLALALVGLAYLQAFVLLPLLFRWRNFNRPARPRSAAHS
jgi:hypothetical protein